MSTLLVATIKSASSAPPVFQNSSGTEKGQLTKAWCLFQGSGTVSITNSFNVSSITDNATGQYTANFSVTLSNPCGVTSGSYNGNAFDAGYADIHNCFAQNTNAQVDTRNMTGTNFDCEFNYGVIFDNT